MNLVDELKTYCQKSTMFLWPMLNFGNGVKPLATYMLINDVEYSKPTLIALFLNKGSNYKNVKSAIMKHECFEYMNSEDMYDYYLFNMEKFHHDYLLVVNGKYSHLSAEAKALILFNTDTILVNAALYPSSYYEMYKDELEININEKEGPELLDLPDFHGNEKISLPKALTSKFKMLEF